MKNFILHIVFITLCFSGIAQTHSAKLNFSARVDTSNQEVISVINLYADYLNSKADSIYDNPYWNQNEKNKYHDFDFSRVSLFQGLSPTQLIRHYPPFVLSVDKIDEEKYTIRVLYSSNATDPKYIGSKVWCIHKLVAFRENDKWVLGNLLPETTNNWNSKKVGFINYHFPPNYLFDEDLALKSYLFCSSIIERFNPNYKDTFGFYICNSIDQMGLLENFDYYFVGITTGKAREGMILSSKGNEFYPHEFIHQILAENKNRNPVIEEGLAVYLGTREDSVAYHLLMSKLANDIESKKEANFDLILSQKVKYLGYPTAYPAGAALCEMAYQAKGDEGLRLLMHLNTLNYDDLISAMQTITLLSKDQLLIEWKNTLLKYKN